MKQDIENIIRTNLPENKLFNGDDEVEYICECEGFNQAISEIDTSLIADEVLKIVVETLRKEFDNIGWSVYDINKLLLTLSTNKENK